MARQTYSIRDLCALVESLLTHCFSSLPQFLKIAENLQNSHHLRTSVCCISSVHSFLTVSKGSMKPLFHLKSLLATKQRRVATSYSTHALVAGPNNSPVLVQPAHGDVDCAFPAPHSFLLPFLRFSFSPFSLTFANHDRRKINYGESDHQGNWKNFRRVEEDAHAHSYTCNTVELHT